MKLKLSVFCALLCLAMGCKTTMMRRVEVSTGRITIETTSTDIRTSSLSVDAFKNVATELGFIVTDSFQDKSHPDEFRYEARLTLNGKSTWLILSVDKKQISFIGSVYGTEKEFHTVKQAAELYEQELQKRGIKFKVVTRTSLYPDSIF